jgi:hypothetical protein
MVLGAGTRKVVVIAYANDVTVILTELAEIPLLQNVINLLHTHERATGAKINTRKSNAVPLETFNTSID